MRILNSSPSTTSPGLCYGSRNICKPCNGLLPPPAPLLSPPPPAQQSQSKKTSKGLLAFVVIGFVGIFLGACTLIYTLWAGICCCQQKKVNNSVQPTITGGNANAGTPASSGPLNTLSRSSTIRRQGSRAIMRQSSQVIMWQSGTSSKHVDWAEKFTLSELVAAIDGFSSENKIGKGSFGIVYRGKLVDGREVAIIRGETSHKLKKLQEKETAFDSELAFLSHLHPKHLVGLVGFCEERNERLLVYEYMKNGALYDHLHSKSNSILNSWKMRIKIALDAMRGIEYLHDYSVPPIIHKDIKSSNILLDGNWMARVSDFRLLLMGPKTNGEYTQMKAAGTVGYIDPEYYNLNVLTPRSEGKTELFKEDEEGGLISVVDYAVPMINGGKLQRVLDRRVWCVSLEGRDQPAMADIVTNLESALSLMDHYGDGASATFSIVPESD